jgi:hypothetical protein
MKLLLAPNGNPSNLNEVQYRLVRTPAFKAWFGDWELLYQYKDRYTYEGHDRLFNKPKIGNEYDLVDGTKAKLLSLDKEKGQYEVLIYGKKQFISFSRMLYLYSGIPDVFTEERLSEISKVVDENGEPLVVYHGTDKSNIESFESVIYFTDNKDTAIKYATERYDIFNPKVYSCFLNFKNPRIYEQGSGIIKSGVFATININSTFRKKLIDDDSDGMIGIYPTRWYSEDFKKHERGIDANYIKEKHFITFYSNQIKLADGTNTKFDSNNPDIRYKKGGEFKDVVCSSCGWGWNKHESEEDDVYVCHKCGADNNPAHTALSSQEVEDKLGRKINWWNDDIVYLSGIKYKKVYLRPEYKKV